MTDDDHGGEQRGVEGEVTRIQDLQGLALIGDEFGILHVLGQPERGRPRTPEDAERRRQAGHQRGASRQQEVPNTDDEHAEREDAVPEREPRGEDRDERAAGVRHRRDHPLDDEGEQRGRQPQRPPRRDPVSVDRPQGHRGGDAVERRDEQVLVEAGRPEPEHALRGDGGDQRHDEDEREVSEAAPNPVERGAG